MCKDLPADKSDAHDDTFTLHVGSIEIVLRSEPIEKLLRDLDFDAVVSSDDSMLSMNGGVSAAISRLAGPAVRAEAAKSLPLPVGGIVVTSAGGLPLKYIIHAVTVDWANSILPTERTLRHLMREILSLCEFLEVTRLVIPAMATGAAGFSAEKCAEIVAQAVSEHALNPSILTTVVLPIPELDIRQAFAQRLADSFAGNRHLSTRSHNLGLSYR